MFESLTERLGSALKHLSGQAKLTESNIQPTLAEVKKALLEADVALEVVKAFVAGVKEQALGQAVGAGFNAEQFFVKLVKQQLIDIMGAEVQPLDLKSRQPTVILMAGLQGSGKTTTTGKLVKYLQQQGVQQVMVTSCDVYRPAAIDQLATVAQSVGANLFPSNPQQQPVEIATQALAAAQAQSQEVLIVDTAGRLHVDDTMMGEIKALHAAVRPTETLFVVDSMTGQDAANTARAFDQALALTGVVLTKTDGDARGGAALSIRHITGKPIKFMGTGEKLDALEPFHPERVTSRILGMGDMLSLIEEIERKVDKKQADKLAKKISQGGGFDLADLMAQLQQMNRMGGIAGMLDKLPMMPKGMKQPNDKQITHMIAVISSMTPKERRRPALIRGSRKSRIAKGAGLAIKDVNQVLKHHQQMKKMMDKLSSKDGLKRMMQQFKGQLPPGMLPPMG